MQSVMISRYVSDSASRRRECFLRSKILAIVLKPRQWIPYPPQHIGYPIIIFVVLLYKNEEDSDAAPYWGKREGEMFE
jgi:hypothetical protein